METKMRIKLFTNEEIPQLISDRLVEQSLELNNGPKLKHDGPVSLEINLKSGEDAELAIAYLNKLTGKLPIEAKVKKAKMKKIEDELSDDKPLEDLVKLVMEETDSQEQVISKLREYDFRFLPFQQLEDMNTAKDNLIQLKAKHSEYQFMVRLIKQAKDPINDKWDTRLIFGIKIDGEKVGVIQVYLWGKWHKKYEKPWQSLKEINFKQKDEILITFPEFMDYPMRTKFRAEHRKSLLHKPEEHDGQPFKFSPFYGKWVKYVNFR